MSWCDWLGRVCVLVGGLVVCVRFSFCLLKPHFDRVGAGSRDSYSKARGFVVLVCAILGLVCLLINH